MAVGKKYRYGSLSGHASFAAIVSVSEIIHNPGVKYPVLSTFCIGVLLFVACGYVGYFTSLRLTYQHEQSQAFAALGAEESQQLRNEVEVLHALEMTRIVTKNTPDTIEQNLRYLLKLRTKAPAGVIPIVDLRIATDHAVLAKLYETANQQTDAAAHTELAQSIFRSLGWTDVSLNVVNAAADNQMRSRFAK